MLDEAFRARLTAGRRTPTPQILVRIQCPEPMLKAMKLKLEIDKNEDLEYFKTLFFRNIGIEQMVYDFHQDDVMVRFQVAGHGTSQFITIGFFSIKKEKSTTSIEQFNPLQDNRYQKFQEITKLWDSNSKNVWGSLFHKEDGANEAFSTLISLLLTVHKVNKLKAFL